MGTPVVFLDRDGVINENRPDHVKCWDEFRFLHGAPEAIARLSRAGARVFVITNQAIIHNGLATHQAVTTINQRMVQEIRRAGGTILDVAYCPHRADEGCSCRKPSPGLLLRLAQRHGVDLREAVVIGDALTDVEAAQAVGSDPILVLTGRGEEQLAVARTLGRNGFRVARDLPAAVDELLDRPRRGPDEHGTEEVG